MIPSDVRTFAEIVYGQGLVLDLFISPQSVYLPLKQEANKDTLVGLAIYNGDSEIE